VRNPAPDADELARRAPEFPDHMIWRQRTPAGVRYIARGLAPRVRPHTLVTSDLSEIWAQLLQSARTAEPDRP
jgi:hypothetical protein